MPFRVGAVPAVRGEGKARIVAPAAAAVPRGIGLEAGAKADDSRERRHGMPYTGH